MAACLVCGQHVGFMKKRLAAHAHDVGVGVRALRGVEDAMGDALDLALLGNIIRDGELMAASMHDYAHGRGGGDWLPSLSGLNHWRHTVNGLVQSWATYDPPSFEAFRSSLASPDTRLIGSMLVGRSG